MNGHATAPIRPPQSIAEVESLIRQLYSAKSNDEVQSINDELQKVQLSDEGWQVADALLGNQDYQVRFFGALTFTVKLNTVGSELDTTAATDVLSRLIFWLIQLSHDPNTLVGKKLCSTLAIYSIRSPIPWKLPLLQLTYSLANGVEAADAQLNSPDIRMEALLPRLDVMQLKQLLWFCSSMAEEIGRADSSSMSNFHAHNMMEEILPQASALMRYALQYQRSQDVDAGRVEALFCFQNWIIYAQPVWPKKPENLEHLRNLIKPALMCLADENLQRNALDVFRDVLESYTSFFRSSHLEILAQIIHTHIRPMLQSMLHNEDPDAVAYGQLIIAYGDAIVEHFAEDGEDKYGAMTVLELHIDILKAPGYPGDDDELSILTIEFWNTFTEFITDAAFSRSTTEPGPAWLERARIVLSQVVELIYRKMIVPPTETARTWNGSENDGFKEFRLDATDLLLSIYLFLKRPMLEQIVGLALTALRTKQWRDVEAALFCLNAMADNILEEPASEDIVRTLFGSSLFRDVADFTQNIPSKTRRTAIDMLGSYGQYIERHDEFLPDAVRFLFASLDTPLCNTAAKSIASLCSTCRANLTGDLPAFIDQYRRFIQSKQSDAYSRDKVIGAIASILQSYRPESAKVAPLMALLEIIESEIQACKEYASKGDMQTAETVGVDALRCLASIGKGMQVPDDIPIDLYEDDAPQSLQLDFWQTSDGQAVQQRIVSTFAILSVLPLVGEAIEAVCSVLRTGYAEVQPGPFVLPPAVTVNLLQQCSTKTPQVEAVLGTVSILISQYSRSSATQIDAEILAVCEKVVSLILELGTPAQDPSVANGCIDILGRLLPRYARLLFAQESPIAATLSAVLNFTLQAIDGQDFFPKRSAQEFWTRIFKDSKTGSTPETQACSQQIVEAYGPQLCQILMRQIGGAGQRSELDLLCDPLKAVLTTQVAAKSWLEAALVGETFPQVHAGVGLAEKQRFLQQLLVARGDMRRLKELVREFYAACRGTVVSYGAGAY